MRSIFFALWLILVSINSYASAMAMSLGQLCIKSNESLVTTVANIAKPYILTIPGIHCTKSPIYFLPVNDKQFGIMLNIVANHDSYKGYIAIQSFKQQRAQLKLVSLGGNMHMHLSNLCKNVHFVHNANQPPMLISSKCKSVEIIQGN